MDVRSARPFVDEKPSDARSWLALVMCLLSACLTGGEASAQEPTASRAGELSEAEAVERALRRAPLTEAIAGSIELERGAGVSIGAYPNPQISYVREQTFGPFGTGEDYLTVSQTIDLGNRRGLRREAGEHRAHAAELEGRTTRADVAAETRLRFFEALARERRVLVLVDWERRIEAALSIVARRRAAGDAAPYDERRLERERAVALGRLDLERAAHEVAIARLRAILGEDEDVDEGAWTLSGPLLPERPEAQGSVAARVEGHPSLLALDARLLAADADATSARRYWAPDFRLEAGWKGVRIGPQGRADGFVLGTNGRADGFLVGGTLTLPLWDPSRGLALAARGDSLALRGRRELLRMELEGRAAGLAVETVRLCEAAERLRERTESTSADLVRMTTAAYDAGEMSVLELLDAYRGAADDALSVLDVEHSARRARIELDRTLGWERP